MKIFRPPQIPILISSALYEAERELLSAQHNLEHYESVVHMLKKRIARLKSATEQPLAAASKEPLHGNEKVLVTDSRSTPRGSGRHGIAGAATQLASVLTEEGGLVAGAGKKGR